MINSPSRYTASAAHWEIAEWTELRPEEPSISSIIVTSKSRLVFIGLDTVVIPTATPPQMFNRSTKAENSQGARVPQEHGGEVCPSPTWEVAIDDLHLSDLLIGCNAGSHEAETYQLIRRRWPFEYDKCLWHLTRLTIWTGNDGGIGDGWVREQNRFELRWGNLIRLVFDQLFELVDDVKRSPSSST